MPDKNKPDKISRRRFIDAGIAGSMFLGTSAPILSALAVQGCQPATGVTFGACYHDCPDTCSWKVTTEAGKVTGFEAVTDHPYTRGKLCGKMDKFPWDVTYHPDRILYPLKRTGEKGEGKFEPVNWDQALTEISDRLKVILAKEGPAAVLPYSYAGTEGVVHMNCISGRFFARLGASRLDRHICGDTAVTGVSGVIGMGTPMVPEDIQHSRYIILWGTNTINTNQHLWPFVEEARSNGARLVVIDPLKTGTAAKSDWHLRPVPGTDAALALGMMHIIIREDLYDREYVENYTVGFGKLKEHVLKFPPEKVAEITGLDPEEIVVLAREYAATRPSCIRTMIGMEHHANGASTFRAIAGLPGLTGAWRHQGGGMLNLTFSLFGEALNYEDYDITSKIEDPSIRSFNMVQIGKALTQPDLIPPIRALIVYNSNPAVIAPNQNLVKKGLAREDLLTVVLEHFMTDTARYADYIFPATTQLEHWDLQTSWGQTYISLNQPAIAPMGEAKSNAEFFRLLSAELGLVEDYLYESDLNIIRKFLKSSHPYMKDISFSKLKKNGWAKLNLPDPYVPYAQGNFPTSSGKCEFYSESLAAAGISGLPDYLPILSPQQDQSEENSRFPLFLISPKSAAYFLNSSHANQERHLAVEKEPFLDINPVDAEKREIRDGDMVKVSNKSGRVMLRVRVTENIRSGVVSIPHGWWPSRMEGGSSANALTPDGLTDQGGGSNFHDARVEVERIII
ncbi:MAG: molybdopterin oxidoreductase family protein [Cyclobacteriaceae bacterium]|nr:molybdopterin oxidoreductase family protein [Cyclobacteriaceae bacterium]